MSTSSDSPGGNNRDKENGEEESGDKITGNEDSDSLTAWFGPRDRNYHTSETGKSQTEICHKNFIIREDYFNYRPSKRASQVVFVRLFNEIRGLAIRENWTKGNDKILAKRLQ
ncbi:hypothetical protein GP486_007527 [Trichoglossum hirsutum]|uniref:Uncharacterized protein n=1 Tax=Trichoglossum hirsutum TaxID=265104 RepID=A0A9P8IBP2_9PEZI|nr:hypothetical protein GP486_007527 [Trichoglossum hirsutum]